MNTDSTEGHKGNEWQMADGRWQTRTDYREARRLAGLVRAGRRDKRGMYPGGGMGWPCGGACGGGTNGPGSGKLDSCSQNRIICRTALIHSLRSVGLLRKELAPKS